MAPKAVASTALFLCFNLIFFTLVSSTYFPPPPAKPEGHEHHQVPQPPKDTCPRDTLELGVCATLLGLGTIGVGSPITLPCCNILDGLVDLDAALCLCTAIKANIMGMNLDVQVCLSMLLSFCGKNVPDGFECA